MTVAIMDPDEKLSTLLEENNLDHAYQNCPVICMSTSKKLFCLILKDEQNFRFFSNKKEMTTHSFVISTVVFNAYVYHVLTLNKP